MATAEMTRRTSARMRNNEQKSILIRPFGVRSSPCGRPAPPVFTVRVCIHIGEDDGEKEEVKSAKKNTMSNACFMFRVERIKSKSPSSREIKTLAFFNLLHIHNMLIIRIAIA